LSLPAEFHGGAVYLLDKPAGIPSRSASGQVARAWQVRRHGHAGTLDPDASGVLPILLGRATRLSQYLTGRPKRYSFILILGASTDTCDASGKVLSSADASAVTREAVLKALEGFTGEFSQVVPEFSALHLEGRRAYESARSGVSPEMPTRSVKAWDWDAGMLEKGRIGLSVSVSAGTYVRGLARDIGAVLGPGAHADRIVRLAVGGLTLARCSRSPDSTSALVPMLDALDFLPRVDLDEAATGKVRHGLPFESVVEGLVTLASGGRLMAVGQGDGSIMRPSTVLEGE